jgi:hypothetical protein
MKNDFLQNLNKFAKSSMNGVKNTSLAWYWANLSAVKIWTLNFNHNAENAAFSFKNLMLIIAVQKIYFCKLIAKSWYLGL